ncbi:hypothetical protein AOQ70_14400 [Bacillus sp. AM 13(2015)]|nr:hypothetical protein AOQ70_14400 [Bacillus sp. AM 13(2015)]
MIVILNMELLHLSTIENNTTDTSSIIIVPIEKRQFNELFPIFVYMIEVRMEQAAGENKC